MPDLSSLTPQQLQAIQQMMKQKQGSAPRPPAPPMAPGMGAQIQQGLNPQPGINDQGPGMGGPQSGALPPPIDPMQAGAGAGATGAGMGGASGMGPMREPSHGGARQALIEAILRRQQPQQQGDGPPDYAGPY